jgi:glycosyltransferase involved in cell wall biosynthesis
MKVTIVGPAYPLRGGIAHHVYYLKRELTGRGHAVQVVSFRQLYPSLLFPGTTQLDTSASGLDAGGVPLLTPVNPITWFKAFRAIRAFSPEIVIFQWWHPFFAPMVGTLARLCGRVGLKCVIECHNVFSHEGSRFDRWFLKFAARPAHSFITHSTQERNDLLPFVAGKKIGVSALPIPNEFTSDSIHTRSGRTILFFGVVRKYKGLDVLLAAMPKVLSRIQCRLEIAGEFYDPVDKYRQLIHEYGLEQHVRIDNRYIPNEEIVEIFDRSDVLVLPYLSATQSAVARIALANGLPVIASRTGGLSEVVVEKVNGLLFPSGDSNALADRITEYFANDLGPIFARNLMTELTGQSVCTIAGLVERAVQDGPGVSP